MVRVHTTLSCECYLHGHNKVKNEYLTAQEKWMKGEEVENGESRTDNSSFGEMLFSKWI